MSPGNIAIATTAIGGTTETFVQNHILKIAPNRTALLCFDSQENPFDGMPLEVLEFHRLARMPGFFGKVTRYTSLLKNGCSFPLAIKSQISLSSFLRENNVKIVLAEFGFTACWISSAMKQNGIPLFAHFHGVDATADPQYWQSRYAYKRLARSAVGVIAPSVFLANKVTQLGFPSERIHIVPYGVDIDHFSPLPENRSSKSFDILAVGRLVEKKSPHTTIRAFGKAVALNPDLDLKLTIVGDGPLKATCEHVTADLDLQGHVIFLGNQHHDVVREQMQRSHIFVQHSVEASNGDMEGLPVSILEAMACGLPVVATWHSGIPEAVSHGDTGLLVAEHDVEGMADALHMLVSNSQLRLTLGESAREQAVHKFSLSKSINRLRHILEIK